MADEISAPRRRDTGMVYAEARLDAWASWTRSNRERLGCPTISILYKAMQHARRATAEERAIAGHVTAQGQQTQVMRRYDENFIPEPVAEVDSVVAKLPRPLHKVIVANYFTYGAIEVRAKAAGMKRARFSQLLEAARYSVFVGLDALTPG